MMSWLAGLWILASSLGATPPLISDGEMIADAESLLTVVSRRDAVHGVAWGPGGDLISITDHSIQAWDPEAGVLRARAQFGWASVEAIAFSGDRGKVAIAAMGEPIRLWNVLEREDITPIEGVKGSVSAMAFSPADLLALATEHGELCYSRGTLEECRTISENKVDALVFDTGGKHLAAATWNELILRNMETGADTAFPGDWEFVESMVFAPEGGRMALGSSTGAVYLLNAEYGLEERFGSHPDGVSSLAWSPDGQWLASASIGDSDGGKIYLWNLFDEVAGDREAALKLVGHTRPIMDLAWSPDGRVLTSASADGSVRLWAITERGHEVRRLEGHASPPMALGISADGRTLAWSTEIDSLHIWDTHRGFEIARYPSSEVRGLTKDPSKVTALASHEDSVAGRQIALGYGSRLIQLWTPDTGRTQALAGHTGPISDLAFSPNRQALASAAHRDQSVRVWDLAPVERDKPGDEEREIPPHLELKGHIGGASAVAWAPQGVDLLATGTRDGNLRLWEVGPGQTLVKTESFDQAIATLGFQSREEIVVVFEDQSILIWNSEGRSKREVRTASGLRARCALGPNGELLACSEFDAGIVKLGSVGLDSTYDHDWTLLSGARGTWAGCQVGGQCWRHDDGTLLVREEDQHKIVPVRPQEDLEGPQLEVSPYPDRLVVTDGEMTTFTVTVENVGKGPAYWVRVDARLEKGARAVFHPPRVRVLLKPGKEEHFTCAVSIPTDYENPVGRVFSLPLVLASSHGEKLLDPIEVQGQLPSVKWGKVTWKQDPGQLTVTATNAGGQSVKLNGLDVTITGLDQPLRAPEIVTLEPGKVTSIPVDIPSEFKPGWFSTTKVTLSARQINPRHLWIGRDIPLIVPAIVWVLRVFYFGVVILVGYLAFRWQRLAARRQRLMQPLVASLSAKPERLRDLPVGQLGDALLQLNEARLTDNVLAAANVQRSRLDAAIRFAQMQNLESRCEAMANRLNAKLGNQLNDGAPIWLLLLGPSFPINMDKCLLFLPPPDLTAINVIASLESHAEARRQTTIILSSCEEQQGALYELANPCKPWVAPSSAQLTRIFLDVNPMQVVSQLVASQVSLTEISPYYSGGGVMKEKNFYGREEFISHIMNRELANYFIIGGRQIGKSSLLKALERRYKDIAEVKCRYIVPSSSDVIHPITKVLNLSKGSGLDVIQGYVRKDQTHSYLFLIDEADEFVREDRKQNYSMLKEFRSLSETGVCHFVLAGFWDLYDSLVHDHGSPLKNFGEVLRIGSLEHEACLDLAIKPMDAMNIHYESKRLAPWLVEQVGQRANLIVIVCNEILKEIDPEVRKIGKSSIAQALQSTRVKESMGSWGSLEWQGDSQKHAELSRLDRIIVYSTYDSKGFSLSKMLDTLEELGTPRSPEKVKHSLERLELVGVLKSDNGTYSYQVPIFRQFIQSQDPKKILDQELRDLG